MWVLNTWNVAGMTEELYSKFYFILMQLKLNGHKWLLSVILQSTFNRLMVLTIFLVCKYFSHSLECLSHYWLSLLLCRSLLVRSSTTYLFLSFFLFCFCCLFLMLSKAGGEGDDRGWDGWMASPTQWTWVWVNSRSWWWTGRPGVLRFMGWQRVGHDWATELNFDVITLK